MEMGEQRDSNPDGLEMEMGEQRDSNTDELTAIQALAELARASEIDYFVTWGRKWPRSRGVYSSCNSGDAMAAAASVSPTTPLRWSGNDKVSAPGSTSSDTAAASAPRLCDRRPKLKVEKKSGVHKPPIGKGFEKKVFVRDYEKKTFAELKKFIGLSSNTEEMEKLALKLSTKLSTKGEPQLSAKSPTTISLDPTVSLDSRSSEASNNIVEKSSSTAAVGLCSSVEGVCHSNDTNWVGKSLRQDSLASTKSSSHAFALPDLNMAVEDVEYLSENQVVQTNSKTIVATEAMKYRKKLPDLNMVVKDVEYLSENQAVQTNSKAIIAAEAMKYRKKCRLLKHKK